MMETRRLRLRTRSLLASTTGFVAVVPPEAAAHV